ncbi:MAG: Rrf2 family transcriptional regulator [Thiogranum sp.]|nr:Rrf2 family transcriptional regulator [Thiogranum sp.]
MKLTTFSDYTLRVLIYLALRQDRLSTIGEIAEAYGISRNHLMKVVHYLGTEGYLDTVRGKGGGVRLAMAPEHINIGGLVRQTESSTVLVECFDPAHSNCAIEPACALHGMLRQALESFFAVLDRYTLADILRNRARLAKLLDLPRTTA